MARGFAGTWLGRIAVLLVVLVAVPALAGDAVFMKDGIAIRGYDAVAYQTEGRAVRGDDRYSLAWHGADWHFVSPENKALFAAEPERWSPQFGGFCAWAMSQGFKAGTNPEMFKVADGRLYLIYSKTTLERWEPQMRTLIPLAEANWIRLWDK